MKKLHLYYIAESHDNKQYNAAIVRKDNESILDSNHFTALIFPYTKEGSLFVKLSRVFSAIQMAFSVKQNSLILFQFPLLANAYKWLQRILKWRGVKTVALVIDIDGIRDKDQAVLKNELQVLQQFDYIIDHNISMRKKLLEYLPAKKILSINLFDYPFEGNVSARQLSNTICFAGNLSKSTFIYELDQIKGLHFNIYGPGYENALNNREAFTYKGIAVPAILPSVLEGSFGLVWDGNSTEKGDEYLRYNNPHKLSLYLASGLPVIVWKDSAAAALVENNHIGICVQSLTEIAEKIKNLPAADYETMRNNTLILGEQVRKGAFLKKVISRLLQDE